MCREVQGRKVKASLMPHAPQIALRNRQELRATGHSYSCKERNRLGLVLAGRVEVIVARVAVPAGKKVPPAQVIEILPRLNTIG